MFTDSLTKTRHYKHASKRLFERFGSYLTVEYYNLLVEKIISSFNSEVFQFENLFIVFSAKDSMIKTFLTEEMVERKVLEFAEAKGRRKETLKRLKRERKKLKNFVDKEEK